MKTPIGNALDEEVHMSVPAGTDLPTACGRHLRAVPLPMPGPVSDESAEVEPVEPVGGTSDETAVIEPAEPVEETAEATPSAAAGTLKSVGTALDLLACFAHEPELGVSDVARRLGIAKSTAHRLLSTLRSRGVVEHDATTGLYRLGLRLAEFGSLARDRHPVRHVILSHLVELRRASGMSVRVGAPDGGDIVHVDHLSASSSPTQLEQMPWRLPLHHSAAGLAICAFNPDIAAVRRSLGVQNPPGGPDFDATLRQVRRLGYAVQRDGAVRGVMTVSAPVCDDDGIAYMGVGLLAPSSEDPRRVQGLGRLVQVAAGRIARAASPIVAERGTALLPSLIAPSHRSSSSS